MRGGQRVARDVVVDAGRRRDHRAGAGVQPCHASSRSSPHPIAPTIARARTAERTTVDGMSSSLVDVVAEPRTVDQLETGEERVVGGVPAVCRDVEDVDVVRERSGPAPRRRSRRAARRAFDHAFAARLHLLVRSVDPRARDEARADGSGTLHRPWPATWSPTAAPSAADRTGPAAVSTAHRPATRPVRRRAVASPRRSPAGRRGASANSSSRARRPSCTASRSIAGRRVADMSRSACIPSSS